MPPTLAPWTADLHVEVAVSAEVEQDAAADALLPALQRLAVIRAIVLLPGSQRHRVMDGDVRRQAGMIAAVSGGFLALLALLGIIAARTGGASTTRGRLAGTTA